MKPKLRLYTNGVLVEWSERGKCWGKIGYISDGIVNFYPTIGTMWAWLGPLTADE